MTWILANWKWLCSAIGAATVVAGLAWLLHNADITRIEARQARELADQATKLNTQCELDKKLTKEVSHAYEDKISVLNDQLARLKRVRPSACVPVSSSGSAAGRDGASGAGQPARQDASHGVTSDALYDFAGEAEKYRLQLMSCQDFINKTWAGR